jgi:hypothetical protein
LVRFQDQRGSISSLFITSAMTHCLNSADLRRAVAGTAQLVLRAEIPAATLTIDNDSFVLSSPRCTSVFLFILSIGKFSSLSGSPQSWWNQLSQV